MATPFVFPEPWMADEYILLGLGCAQFCCPRCGRYLSMDDGPEGFPYQIEGRLLCVDCAGIELRLRRHLCSGCARKMLLLPGRYRDPEELISHGVAQRLWSAFWSSVGVWVDAWSVIPYLRYFCGKCAAGVAGLVPDLCMYKIGRCCGCGRRFLTGRATEGMDSDAGGFLEGEGSFICHRCWHERILERGFARRDFDAFRYVALERTADLKEQRYQLVAEWESPALSRMDRSTWSFLAEHVLACQGVQTVVAYDPRRGRLELWARGNIEALQGVLDRMELPWAVALVLGA